MTEISDMTLSAVGGDDNQQLVFTFGHLLINAVASTTKTSTKRAAPSFFVQRLRSRC